MLGHKDAITQGYEGPRAQRQGGTRVKECNSVRTQEHKGAQAQRLKGTWVQEHKGARACRCKRVQGCKNDVLMPPPSPKLSCMYGFPSPLNKRGTMGARKMFLHPTASECKRFTCR